MKDRVPSPDAVSGGGSGQNSFAPESRFVLPESDATPRRMGSDFSSLGRQGRGCGTGQGRQLGSKSEAQITKSGLDVLTKRSIFEGL